MAKYVILIYEDEQAWAATSEEEAGRILAEHAAFGERNRASLVGGHALHPSGTATSIRRDTSGGHSVTDGAFAETKEALGGFYVVEAPDLEAAVAIARRVPAPFGGVEVRPVRTFD